MCSGSAFQYSTISKCFNKQMSLPLPLLLHALYMVLPQLNEQLVRYFDITCRYLQFCSGYCFCFQYCLSFYHSSLTTLWCLMHPAFIGAWSLSVSLIRKKNQDHLFFIQTHQDSIVANPFFELLKGQKHMSLLIHLAMITSYIYSCQGFQSFIIHEFNANLVCSFLKEEWCYSYEVDISDLTVSDCWKRLPDHIEEKRLPVISVLNALYISWNFYQFLV